MAYRISQPLAATQFNDDKPKKGRKKDAYGDTSSGNITNTVTKRSGAQKTTTTNKSGTKKTVTKVNRKGRVKSTTTDIDLAKGKATTTKRKGGKVVSKKTYKDLTPKQAMMVETGRDSLKAKAARNVKKAERSLSKDDDSVAARKKYNKEQRELNKSSRQEQRHRKKKNRKNKRGTSAQMGKKNKKGRVDPNCGTAGQNRRATKKSCKT